MWFAAKHFVAAVYSKTADNVWSNAMCGKIIWSVCLLARWQYKINIFADNTLRIYL